MRDFGAHSAPQRFRFILFIELSEAEACFWAQLSIPNNWKMDSFGCLQRHIKLPPKLHKIQEHFNMDFCLVWKLKVSLLLPLFFFVWLQGQLLVRVYEGIMFSLFPHSIQPNMVHSHNAAELEVCKVF
jgi:hypothetical protein